GHVVHFGQPRREPHRAAERLHHRPGAPARAPVVRLRGPPLRRQPRRRDATDDPLGRDPQALPGDPRGGRADPDLLVLRPRVRDPARGAPGADLAPCAPRPPLRRVGGAAWHQAACAASTLATIRFTSSSVATQAASTSAVHSAPSSARNSSFTTSKKVTNWTG